jgi:hypothetical protein
MRKQQAAMSKKRNNGRRNIKIIERNQKAENILIHHLRHIIVEINHTRKLKIIKGNNNLIFRSRSRDRDRDRRKTSRSHSKSHEEKFLNEKYFSTISSQSNKKDILEKELSNTVLNLIDF